MFRVDRSLELDGYRSSVSGASVSPIRLTDGELDLRGGPKKYQFVDTPGGAGGVLLEPPKRDTIERPLSLYLYPRFTAAHTNQCTNPRPSGTTGWTAQGTGSTMTDKTAAPNLDPCVEFVTTGSADSGGKFSFTGTAVAWSGGMFVLAPLGAPMKILFDGATAATFTGTGDWQFVKTQGVTLTAAGRSIQVLQTDTGSRTIKVRRCMLYIGATLPLDLNRVPAYWDGTSGDATWTGTADASTSTTLIGVDAMYNAIGVIAEKFDKAEALAEIDGVSIAQRPYSSSYTNEGALVGGEIPKAPLDHFFATGQRAQIDVKLYMRPEILAEEVLAGTLYKPAGCPLCEGTVSAGGQIPGPARLEFTTPDSTDQQLLVGGMQFRNTNSSISALITRGGSLDVTGLSGTITAGINEVQTITRAGTLSGGTGTFTLHGLTTSTITHSSNAAAIQTVLEAHPYIGTGNVTVTGGPLSSTNVVITFTGKLAASNMTQLTWNNSLTGGGTATLSTTTAGVPGYAAAALHSDWSTICGTGNLSDVGDYRIVARVHDASVAADFGKSRLRLMWSVGEGGPVVSNTREVATPSVVGAECLVPLGVISIPPAKQGTQRAKVWIEGRTEGAIGSSMRVLEIMRVPVGESDWTLAAPADRTGALMLSDDFNQTAGNATGKAADIGGNWAGSGDGVDFTIDTTNHRLQRTEVSDAAGTGRLILAGPTATDSEIEMTTFSVNAGAARPMGPVMRGTDANNFLQLRGGSTFPYTSASWSLVKRVGGVETVLGTTAVVALSLVDGLTFSARSDGSWSLAILGTAHIIGGTDSALATAGSLASGKMGIYDEYTSGSAWTRVYDGLRGYVLPAPNVVIPASGKKLIVHADGSAQREAATGVYGELNSVIPNPPRLGPKGNASQTNRVAALISANNWEVGSDPTSNALKIDVYHRPAFEVHQGAA